MAIVTLEGVPAKCEVSVANGFCGEKEGFAQVRALMLTSGRKPKHNPDVGLSSSG